VQNISNSLTLKQYAMDTSLGRGYRKVLHLR